MIDCRLDGTEALAVQGLGHKTQTAQVKALTYERQLELAGNMFVAEVFTGQAGKYVPIRETVRGFKEILDGLHDALPEQAFYLVGSIEEAKEKGKTLE